MKEPAHVAYDAYRVSQLSTGANVPEWGKLTQDEQDAWQAAVRALLGAATAQDVADAARWGDPEPAPSGAKGET